MLEQELAALKKRMATLETKIEKKAGPTWRDAFGAMKGDSLHRDAAALGAAWRAKENKRK